MNAKLEVVRINEDVIATSSAGFGLLGYNSYLNKYVFSWFLDNTDGNMKNNEGTIGEYQGYTENGFYHCDANGNITGKCTHGTKLDQIAEYHHVTNVGG